jgi:surfactin synthase thioesterase subunit
MSDVQLASSLECTVPNSEAPQRLVCFPHAGGAASFYREWGSHLARTEVYAVCYPGRAGRIVEPPPTDLLLLAQEIAEAVQPLADRPLALFGHSMGAPLALETARVLEAEGVRLAHLFASGSRDAESADTGEVVDEDPETVLAQLVALGGTDAELATDPDFQELILPYVLGDSRMFHAYVMEPEPLLGCPVTSIVGDIDPDPDRRPWSRLTEASFRVCAVEGDHFYLVARPPYALVEKALDAAGDQ